MKKRLTILMLGYMLAVHGGFAQDSTRALNKNAVYLELGGNGIVVSANYERMLYEKNKIHLCARVGVGTYLPNEREGLLTENNTLPIAELNLLLGERREFLETGLGFTYNPDVHTDITFNTIEGYRYPNYYQHYVVLRFGYRYQSPGGFLIRVAATPFFYFRPQEINGEWKRYGKLYIYPWLGASFGYSF